MTRIEDKQNNSQVEDLETQVEKLKRSLKGKRNKKVFGCGSCFLLFILLVFLLGSTIAYGLAKSGLRQVPFFTDRFYQEPSPTYLVRLPAPNVVGPDILDKIKNDIIAQARQTQKIENFKVTVSLSEEQITAWLQDKIKTNESLNKKIQYLQLAVMPTKLELFVKTSVWSNMIVTLDIKPEVKNGQVVPKISGFKIGDLKLPNYLGNIIFGYLTEKSLNSILGSASQYGQLQKIGLAQGVVSIEVLIKSLKGLL